MRIEVSITEPMSLVPDGGNSGLGFRVNPKHENGLANFRFLCMVY